MGRPGRDCSFLSGLTPRQARFVEEYLLGLSASAAYRLAGYRAKNDNVAAANASALIRNHKVQAAIRAARAAAQERTGATLDWVVRGLKRTYDLAMLPVPVLDGKGEPTGVYTYKVAAAVRSLDTLARLLGLFP